MKCTLSEMNILLNEIYGKLDTTKEKITEFENVAGELTQNEAQGNIRL